MLSVPSAPHTMSFGRNPHVARALAAQQRAEEASDEPTRERAHREAAHEWDRAAAREKPGKQRDSYGENAARSRALADGEPVDE
jgi:hypothetical protein